MEITDEKLEEMLCACAPEARTLWLDSLPQDGDEPPHAFSPEFQQRMERLIQRKCRARRSSGRGRMLRRVAVVLLTVLLGGGVFLALDGEARAAVLQWFRETTEHSVLFRFTGEAQDTLLPAYSLDWVPDGFSLMTDATDEENLQHFRYYLNGETGDIIGFVYGVMHDGTQTEFLFLRETVEPERFSLNGAYAEFYAADSFSALNTLIWFDESENLFFSIDSTLEKDVILHIFRSIVLDDNTK